jgi:hypothetical protein
VSGSASVGNVDPGWRMAGVGHYDGNGSSDILWQNSTSGRVVVWLMNGLTKIGAPPIAALNPDWVLAGPR